jgi:hypothetical protein
MGYKLHFYSWQTEYSSVTSIHLQNIRTPSLDHEHTCSFNFTRKINYTFSSPLTFHSTILFLSDHCLLSLFLIPFICPSCCHFLLSPISPVRLNRLGKTFTTTENVKIWPISSTHDPPPQRNLTKRDPETQFFNKNAYCSDVCRIIGGAHRKTR